MGGLGTEPVGKTEGRKDGRTERRKDGKTERRKDGKTERRKDGKTERRKDGKQSVAKRPSGQVTGGPFCITFRPSVLRSFRPSSPLRRPRLERRHLLRDRLPVSHHHDRHQLGAQVFAGNALDVGGGD